MLKWTLIILGIPIALVLASVLIGMMVPKDHSAASRARYDQPAEVIWTAITGFSDMPSWRPGIQKVEHGQDRNGHPVWIEVSKFGPMPMEVEIFEPPHRMVLRIADEKLPFGGSWTYVIDAAEQGGATLTITEDGVIHNPLFRFLSRFVFGYHGTQQAYLRALGAKFGEPVTVERVR